jgi:hypothetical protein
MFSLPSSWKSVAIAGVFASALAQVPEGWMLAGNKPAEYDCSIDPSTSYQGLASTYIKSKSGIETSGFGTLSQYFGAAKFAGKRVRFSAQLKSDAIEKHGTVEGWAGLWLRIDDNNHGSSASPRVVGFDNMHQTGVDRAVKGTTPWRNYAVVLDVPEGATGIGLGVLLSGSGAIWISNIKFDVVGPEVPVTASMPPTRTAPENLGFEK